MERELKIFVDFTKQFVSLNDKDVQMIVPHVRYEEYEKKESILTTQQKCTGIYFICEGLFRVYSLKDGVEVNVSFMKENDFFTDYESLMTGNNCKLGLEAIEPTKIIFLPYEKLLESYDKSHMLERLGRLMVERALANLISMTNSSANLKADQKYTEFELNNKDLVNRVPLKHLASFIGITAESLSSLRKSRLTSNS